MSKVNVILSIGGSDSSAGAGIQADLATINAMGAYGLCAVTAVVAETPLELSHIGAVEPALLREQIKIILSTYPVKAVKIGLLPSSEHIKLVAEELTGMAQPIILDPVIQASVGNPLTLENNTLNTMKDYLLPKVTVATPNTKEAAALTGNKESALPPDKLALLLHKKFGTSFVVTGGHEIHNKNCREIIATQEGLQTIEGPAIDGAENIHGTGCAFSSALAVGLANELTLTQAVRQAKQFIYQAIKNSLNLGQGLQALGLQRATEPATERNCI